MLENLRTVSPRLENLLRFLEVPKHYQSTILSNPIYPGRNPKDINVRPANNIVKAGKAGKAPGNIEVRRAKEVKAEA
jgi:hypothetical protein